MLLTILTNSSYSVFLRKYFFTTFLSLLKSTVVVSDFPVTNLATLFFQIS